MSKQSKPKETRPQTSKKQRLEVEELEKRVALSVPDQKKNPNPAPYMPGTLYGLVKRKNL
jgi:hypothetical protein